MGYTRYWTRTNKPYDEDFVEEVRKIIAKCSSLGITICGANGEGSPEISMDQIRINGTTNKDLWHETFCIRNPSHEYFGAERDLCKTARKPYDYAVREILKIAEERGIVEHVTSDGPNDEILSDIDYLKEMMGFELWRAIAYKSKVSIPNSRDIMDKIDTINNGDLTADEKIQKYEMLFKEDPKLWEIYQTVYDKCLK